MLPALAGRVTLAAGERREEGVQGRHGKEERCGGETEAMEGRLRNQTSHSKASTRRGPGRLNIWRVGDGAQHPGTLAGVCAGVCGCGWVGVGVGVEEVEDEGAGQEMGLCVSGRRALPLEHAAVGGGGRKR